MSTPPGTEPRPGFYEYRLVKKGPRVAILIQHDEFGWHVLIDGQPAAGSSQQDWLDVPLLKWRWPLHPISEAEYNKLRDASGPDPTEPVDLRQAPPLF